ncbi:L,D-transpeptidase catalytic domain [Nocardioides scoriae]|uniref:L,D-transpeptidase catalytic domain n=1 Tax=Nocardioides scoriae TaxID=642780 RepID=A0A1H1TRA3_9ACTN|nr:peptidoglycan-binding protein [Nocardioides scoriae]SDS62466.1 L,D-transpeptidase catalytic domain [Nocardioides scoriae]
MGGRRRARQRRVVTGLVALGLVLATTAAGYAVTRGGLVDGLAGPRPAPSAAADDERPTATPRPQVAGPSVRARPTTPAGTTRRPARAPLPAERPRATPPPGPRLLGPGDSGAEVRELQSRLRQIAWFAGDVTDVYGSLTEQAVRGFQAKREIAVTGWVDRRTLTRLEGMTREPTADELANRSPGDAGTSAPLDGRCLTGRALCVDKTSSTLRWVVDGSVRRTVAVRFGSSYTPTREGLFHVESKSPDHVSSLYGSPMPYAMFFSRGQAVHYSSDFAARGYAGASHGCVNVRDLDGLRWIYDQVSLGDAVVVYWS